MNNPHIGNAIHAIGEANNPNSVWESSDAERIALQIEASTRATLALAYEQRTANLIAVFAEGGLDIGADYEAVGESLLERLNLA